MDCSPARFRQKLLLGTRPTADVPRTAYRQGGKQPNVLGLVLVLACVFLFFGIAQCGRPDWPAVCTSQQGQFEKRGPATGGASKVTAKSNTSGKAGSSNVKDAATRRVDAVEKFNELKEAELAQNRFLIEVSQRNLKREEYQTRIRNKIDRLSSTSNPAKREKLESEIEDLEEELDAFLETPAPQPPSTSPSTQEAEDEVPCATCYVSSALCWPMAIPPLSLVLACTLTRT